MAITLLLGGPAMLIVFALFVWAFPRTLMCLEMLGEVARTLEFLVTKRTLMDLRLGVFLASSHGPEDVILVDVEGLRHGTLHRCRGDVLRRNDLVGGDTYSLPVLMTDQLSRLSIVTHPSME